jgi:hypothetical protein
MTKITHHNDDGLRVEIHDDDGKPANGTVRQWRGQYVGVAVDHRPGRLWWRQQSDVLSIHGHSITTEED